MSRHTLSTTVSRANKLRRKGSAGMQTQSAPGAGDASPGSKSDVARALDDFPHGGPRPKFDLLHPIASMRALSLFKDHQVDAFRTALQHERERREHGQKVATEEQKYRMEQSRVLHDTHQEKRARQALTADGVKAAIDDLDGTQMVTAYADQMLQCDVQAIKNEKLRERQEQHILRVHQRIITRIEAATTTLEFDPDEFLPEE